MTDMVKLSDVLQPVKSARAGDREYPLLSMTMHNGLVDQFDKFNKRVASQDTSAYKVIERGQLVVGFPIDEGVLDFQTMYDEAIVSPAYGVWELSGKYEVSREYLGAYLRSDHAIAYYKAKLQGSTARRRSLPNSMFLALPIYLPPLDEQRRIVDILDRADAIRAKRRHMLADFDELKQSVFAEISSSDQFPTVKSGDVILDMRNGVSPSKKGTVRATVLTLSAITQGVFDTSAVKDGTFEVEPASDKRVTNRDFYMCRGNGNKNLVGVGAYSNENRPDLVFPDTVIAGTVDENRVLLPYLEMIWRSRPVRNQIEQSARTTNGTYKVNQQSLANIDIPLPPISLQREFARRVEAIAAARAKVERALALDDELFASLQSRAFRGER